MRKTLNLLFAVGMGFSLNSFAYSQGALDQLASESLSHDTKLNDKEISLKADRPFNAILEQMGFDKVNILISKQETDYQEKKAENCMPFKAALKEAFEDIMIDNGKRDSLYRMALARAYKNLKIKPQQIAHKSVLKETVKILKSGINSGESEIKLFGLPRVADQGESTKTNWVFHLHVPKISPKGFFIIVDKARKKDTNNYQSFISYHNSDMSGDIDDAPKIENNQKPAATNGIGGDSDLADSSALSDSQALGDGLDDSRVGAKEPASIAGLRNQGRILYDNYGAQFTMVKYDGWPGNIPIYGDFAVPYKNYLSNARKIDRMRVNMRDRWIKLNENVSPAKAQIILTDMKKMGREYDRLIGELLQYVRQGQQLYSEGKATFPSLLYNVRLIKGSTYVDLYDDNGKQITKKKCSKWEVRYSVWGGFTSFYGMGGSAYRTVCVEYKEEPVKAKVPDYHLEYGYGGDQTYPHRARMIDVPPTSAFPEVFIQESVKRDQYDMEITVACTLDKDPNKGWLVSKARLRKGKATSSDSLGGSVGVNGKVGIPLVIEGGVSVNVNYGHTWSHFRFGEMVDFPKFVGKPCFELNRAR